MGTRFEIQIYDSDRTRAEQAATKALDEMARVDRLLSNHNPESELSAMNREAARAPFQASAELFSFVETCRRLRDDSLGAFDPTVGPIVRAWGFLTAEPARPADSEILAAKERSGFDKVRLNERERTISYSVPGLEIDPGGIGKGYAVDQGVQILMQEGIESALVSAGGSTLYALGRPPGRDGWRVAIENPSDWRRPLALVELHDNSLSTSGTSERSVTVGTRRYSHVIDPRTGDPVDDMCQVTAVAPSGTESEAWTKAAFILSRESLTELLTHEDDGVYVYRVEGPCGADSSVWMPPQSSQEFEPAKSNR